MARKLLEVEIGRGVYKVIKFIKFVKLSLGGGWHENCTVRRYFGVAEGKRAVIAEGAEAFVMLYQLSEEVSRMISGLIKKL